MIDFPVYEGDKIGIKNIDAGELIAWATRNSGRALKSISVVAHDKATYERLVKECRWHKNIRVWSVWHMAQRLAKLDLGQRTAISGNKYLKAAERLLKSDRRPLAIDPDKAESAERIRRHCFSARLALADLASHDSLRASVEWDGEEFAREDLLAVQEILLDGESDTASSKYMDYLDFAWYSCRKQLNAKVPPQLLIVPNVERMDAIQLEIVKLYTGRKTRLVLGMNGQDWAGVNFAPRALPVDDWHTDQSYAKAKVDTGTLEDFVKSDAPNKIVVCPWWRAVQVASEVAQLGAVPSIKGDGFRSDVQSLASRFSRDFPSCNEDWGLACDSWRETAMARAKARKAKAIAYLAIEKQHKLLNSIGLFATNVLDRRIAVNELWNPGGTVAIASPKRLEGISVKQIFVAFIAEMRDEQIEYIRDCAQSSLIVGE